MEKIYRLIGKRGRTTVPFEIRMKMRIGYNSLTHFYYGSSSALPSTSGSFSGNRFVIRWNSSGSTYYTGTAIQAPSWKKPPWSDLIPLG